MSVCGHFYCGKDGWLVPERSGSLSASVQLLSSPFKPIFSSSSTCLSWFVKVVLEIVAARWRWGGYLTHILTPSFNVTSSTFAPRGSSFQLWSESTGLLLDSLCWIWSTREQKKWFLTAVSLLGSDLQPLYGVKVVSKKSKQQFKLKLKTKSQVHMSGGLLLCCHLCDSKDMSKVQAYFTELRKKTIYNPQMANSQWHLRQTRTLHRVPPLQLCSAPISTNNPHKYVGKCSKPSALQQSVAWFPVWLYVGCPSIFYFFSYTGSPLQFVGNWPLSPWTFECLILLLWFWTADGFAI